jgi:hypothetical protein
MHPDPEDITRTVAGEHVDDEPFLDPEGLLYASHRAATALRWIAIAGVIGAALILLLAGGER